MPVSLRSHIFALAAATGLCMLLLLGVGNCKFDNPDPVTPCSLASCFNLTKCRDSFSLYLYPIPNGQYEPGCVVPPDGFTSDDQQSHYYEPCFVHTLLTSGFQLTSDPTAACLLVPTRDATCAFNICTADDLLDHELLLKALPHWNGGQNHVHWSFPNDWPSPGGLHAQAVAAHLHL